jgi:dihydroorotate dehydrogenase (NAD+) catalytic subunit
VVQQRAVVVPDGLAGYELNVSCPNTEHGGIYFSSDPALLSEVVAAAKRVAARPLIVKLSPNVSAIEPLARAAEASGADAISLVNTFVSLAIDARTRRPRIGAGFGGLSGPAIKPIALRLVCQAARAVKIPVIGLGGIATGNMRRSFDCRRDRGASGDGDVLTPGRQCGSQRAGRVSKRGRWRAWGLVGTLKL